MKLAAIDIGSNGARLLISRVLEHKPGERKLRQPNTHLFKDVEYIRYALQLGKDVFRKGKIGKKRQDELFKLMQVYRLMLDLHEVDDCMALATSAFREAENGQELVDYIATEIGIQIEIIDGTREAEILNRVIIKQLEPNKNHLHIDVGGGSTELNLYVNQSKVATRSFEVGSIRNVADSQKAFVEMQSWIEAQLLENTTGAPVIAVGTGGNINKIHALLEGNGKPITRKEIIDIVDYVNGFTFAEKVNLLELNPDRADTIIPATNIYLYAMEWANAEVMIVPKLGLKDGMMEEMFERQKNKQKVTKSSLQKPIHAC
jgi:exopolyphosphatase/guanosine-5'-triphosphate,3'-diphosphate pyrophosphatase